MARLCALASASRAKYAVWPCHICSKTTSTSLTLNSSRLWYVSGFCVNSVWPHTAPALCHKHCKANLIVAHSMIAEKRKFSFFFAYLDSGLVLCPFRYWCEVIWWQQVDVRQPSWAQSPEVGNSSRVLQAEGLVLATHLFRHRLVTYAAERNLHIKLGNKQKDIYFDTSQQMPTSHSVYVIVCCELPCMPPYMLCCVMHICCNGLLRIALYGVLSWP